MRQVEKTLGIAILVILIYTIICLFINFIVNLGIPIPNVTVIIIAGLLSGVIGAFGPFWNTGKYLKIQNIKTIVAYEIKYKAKFTCNFMGCLGIICILRSKDIFDSFWWIGVLITLWYLVYLYILIFKRPLHKN
jgi:hypothetical protein